MRQNESKNPAKQPKRTIEPAQVAYQCTEYYQGLISHPEIIQRFEQIYPGAAGIIFRTFEAQAAHRMELEKKVIDRDTKDSRLGLIFGFLIGLAGIVGGVACILYRIFPGLIKLNWLPIKKKWRNLEFSVATTIV